MSGDLRAVIAEFTQSYKAKTQQYPILRLIDAFLLCALVGALRVCYGAH